MLPGDEDNGREPKEPDEAEKFPMILTCCATSDGRLVIAASSAMAIRDRMGSSCRWDEQEVGK